MMNFFHGACAMASVIIGLFFLHHWRTSRDRLFAFFVAAFWILALHWVGLAIANPTDESRHWLYALRLLTFLLIIAAIIDKNRRRRA